MKDNLILIGMPGAGKSTIGVILAKTLAMDFVDSDLVICKETGRTLQDILDKEGQDAFLKLENQIVSRLNPTRTVVATGGSVPMEPEAMAHLKELGTVIYLKVGLEELRKRLGNIKTRGIAFGPGETLDTLYAYRVPIYESWAELTIEADPNRNDIENMVDQIVERLKAL
ncbi:MAG: shikimate kinase [Oscillospiraceae bacterium]|nr:shikimate kinase [Oscillospiraceae bacterium]